MGSFRSPEIVKPESESEKSPGSRSTEDREENRSDDPRESSSLEYIRGDEVIIGKIVGEGEKLGKRDKSLLRGGARTPIGIISYLVRARRVDYHKVLVLRVSTATLHLGHYLDLLYLMPGVLLKQNVDPCPPA